MKIHRNLDQLPDFKKSVLTIGSFDGLHLGHQKILDRVKDYALQYNAPSVVVTFEPHPRQVIYPSDHTIELLTVLQEKIILFEKTGIDHLVVVPFTVEFAQLIPQEYIENFLVKLFTPYCVVIGYDHHFGLNRGGDVHMLRRYGDKYNFKVIQIPKQECDAISISSTKIRRAISNRDIRTANKLLGHPYFFIGEVIHGKKVGTGLGFPTANLRVNNKNKIVPPEGIYSVLIYHGKDRYQGMMYVGNRPTLETSGQKSIEVHIFEFNQYIYGDTLLVEIVEFMRDDEKFDDLDTLKANLKVDKANSQVILEEYLQGRKKKDRHLGAVALLNFNGLKHLPDFLHTIIEHTPDHFKIYLIDNHSTDLSVEWTRENFPSIEIIELLDNTGYAGGYNRGLKLIQEKYIALINTDVAFDSDWLTPAIQFLEEHQDVAALQPKILSHRDPEYFEYAGAAGGFMDILSYPFCRGRIFNNLEKDKGQYDHEMEIFWASGAAFIVRNDLFQKIGGFDDSFFAHMEEIDLCWRLKKAGYKIYCLPKLRVFHYGGGTLDYENPRKTFLNFRNNLITILKNESKRRLVWLLPTRMLLDIAASFHFLLQGKIQLFNMVLKAHWAMWRMLPKITIARRKFNLKVKETKFQPSRTRYGRYYYSIVWQFFIKNKKRFSELNYFRNEASRY